MYPRLKSGEISPLYLGLKDYFGNRDEAMYWFTRAKSKEFTQVFPNVKMSDKGEPLLQELLDKCGLKEAIDESKLINRLNKENEKVDFKTYQGVKNIQSSIVDFNNSSTFKDRFYATLTEFKDGNNTKVKLVVKPKRELSDNEDKRIEVNYKLNERLEDLIKDWGLEVGSLTKLEESLGMNGVTDLDVAKESAEGIKSLIRIAKGNKGQAALPEEVAHFATAAMEDNPLKDRLLKVLNNEEVLKSILGDAYENYAKLYSNNTEVMAMEALGKLVAMALNDENVFIGNKRLFDRYLNTLKRFFSNHSTDEIDNIIKEVMSDVYELTNNIVNNRYKLNVNNIHYKVKLANLNENVDRESTLLKKIIDQELKRLKIYGTKEEFNNTQTKFIQGLQAKLKNHQAIDGIYDYITNSLSVLNSLSKRMADMDVKDTTTQEQFSTLRNVRNFISSYGTIMEEIRKELRNAIKDKDDEFVDKLEATLKLNTDIIGNLSEDFFTKAKEKFTEFIRPFIGEKLTITIGKDKGKTYTAEELIEYMDRDISIVDRWLDSMADSTDPMLQIYDQIVKKQKGLARLDTIKIEKEIERKTRELELAGYKSTEFMYEKDENGKPTGRFISSIWWSKFYKARNAFFKTLDEKYGDNPTEAQNTLRKKEIQEWYANNTVKNDFGASMPNSSYENPEFKKLSKAQIDYYNYITDLKAEYDAILPRGHSNMVPQIRRDFIDRMRKSSNKVQYFWESMKDNLVRREDDEGLGDKSTIMDFEGNEVMTLPIYYTRPLEDMNDLSLDIASSMIAYISMVNDYNRMNEVIDTLEVGRIVLSQRKIKQIEGGKQKKEVFEILGEKVENSLFKKGEATRFMQKLNDFMKMRVYDRTQNYEGNIYGIDVAKGANFLNKLTSLSTTAASLLTGVANAAQNITMSTLEAFSKEYFNKTELIKADIEYAKELGGFVSEIGNRIKTNKLALFSELFNVPQDYKHHVRNIDFNKKTKMTRLLNESSLYFLTSSGDHYTQHRIAIALALRMPMKYKGETTNLWNVLEVKPLDKNNPKLGAELVIKEGATKVDGSKFTRNDIIKFSNKIRAMENRLYGIYNDEDSNALLQYSYGRLILFFRNWMRPLWLARFGRGKFNFDLGECVGGHFETLFNFTLQNIKDIKNSEFDIVRNWKNLNITEKANIRKGAAEVAFYWMLYFTINALGGLGDDKHRPWLVRLLSYALVRLKTDMGALLPSPTMLDEGLKLFTSPFAAMSTLSKLRNTLNLVNPVSIIHDDVYTKEIESGRYEGFKEYQKILIDLLPFRRQIINAFDPEEPARWYK